MISTLFYFQLFFFLCFAVMFHFTFSFELFFLLFFIQSNSILFVLQSCSILLLALNYFFFYFLFSPKKTVNFEWQPSATIVMVDLQFI